MSIVNQRMLFEIPDKSKAIIYVNSGKSGRKDLACLVDTGANLPVWFSGEEFLKLRFPMAKKMSYTTIISGLGQKPHLNVPI